MADRERIKGEAEQLTSEKQDVEKSISVLDSRRGQQVSLLKRIAPEVAQGWQWLEENKGQFSQEIFGPPMVTCSVKDKRYSNLVQSLLHNDDFLCFTAQNVQDHKKLSDQFYDVMGLSVTIRTCTTAFGQFRSPLTPEELSALGLDGLAVDFLEGPEPVLSMLCTERRLHGSPVSLEKPQQGQYDMLVTNEKISTWAAKDQSYRVSRRREYGAHAVSTSVRDIRPGRYWSEGQADMSEITELQRKLAQLNKHILELRQEYSAASAKAAGPAEKMADIDSEIVSPPYFLYLPSSHHRVYYGLTRHRSVYGMRRISYRWNTASGARFQRRSRLRIIFWPAYRRSTAASAANSSKS